MGERPVETDVAPLFVSNMRGDIVPTRRSEKTGYGRYGFFRADPRREDAWLNHTVATLASQQVLKSAPFQDALNLMEKGGIPAYHLVIPYDQVKAFTGEDATPEEVDSIMSERGFFKEIFRVKVIVGAVGLPLLVAHPNLAGFHTRSDNYLGIMLLRISSAWCITSA